MKTPASFRVAQIALMALGALCSGCSLLGLAVDASRQPDTLAVDPGEKALEGKIVFVTLQDGYSFAGECRRLGNLPGELYRPRYARWQELSGKRGLPLALDDTLHVAWDHGRTTVGSLEGFTRTSVIVLPLPTASALFRQRPQVLSIPVEKIDSLKTPDGTLMHGGMVRAQLEEGNVPTTDAMVVRRGETSTWVPLDEIVRICEIRYSYQWFHTGAIADAAGLAATLVFLAVSSGTF